ncbi:MAG: Flp pilus assembly protein CpaB [Gammaproteobacteria bacterium]|nr:Flp pilus assembly protein CpaB [Gammaproteobacteria bacterium]
MLRFLAGLLAIGSVVIGYVGYRLSQNAPAGQPDRSGTSVSRDADVHPVIVAQRDIPAGHSIVADDLTSVPFPLRPAHTYSKTGELLGKTPTLPIAAGEAPLERHFLPGSLLARSIHPGERAVAVKVDEVIGGGGLVQPGDYVDVLLYLRGGGKELPKSLAQVVLKHARVLAYGDAVIGAADAVAGDDDARAPKGLSAVLAVPLEQTAPLMLAASAGTLRLAVYGAEESQAVAAGAKVPTGARPITLGELTQQRNSESVRQPNATVNIFHGSRKEVVEAK